MRDMGIEPGRYIVGNELNSKNPVTGQPEFFSQKNCITNKKSITGILKKFLGTIVGLATGKPLPGACSRWCR